MPGYEAVVGRALEAWVRLLFSKIFHKGSCEVGRWYPFVSCSWIIHLFLDVFLAFFHLKRCHILHIAMFLREGSFCGKTSPT